MNLNRSIFKASLFLLITISLSSACTHKAYKKQQISRVEVATGYRYGPSQKTAVSIDSTLAYHYYGGQTFHYSPSEKSSMLSGYYTGKVTKAFWDALNVKLNAIRYEQLDTIYRHSIEDQSLEIIIYYQGKVKHIRAQSESLPHDVGKVIYWIADSYKVVKLGPSKDTLAFHTNEQLPLETPAKPLFAPAGVAQ